MKGTKGLFRLGAITLALSLMATLGACPTDDNGGGNTGGGGGTTYTVTYSAGIGSGPVPASQTVTAGTVITLPGQESMTAPSGQTFNGWKDYYNSTDYSVGDSYTVNANVTFTAQWTTGGGGTQYTVTYLTGIGSGSAPASQTVTAGTVITLPGQESMTAPSGQTFNGWKDAGGTAYSAGTSYTVNANVAFTAQWTTGGGGDDLESDIDPSLLGTWKDNMGGAIITVTFGSDGTVTWGGTAASPLNAATSVYQGTGYQFVWVATGGKILYKFSGPSLPVQTVDVYDYSINSLGQLELKVLGATFATLIKE